MNREILFRGKRTDNGEWVYGFFWKDIWGDGESCYILYDGENYPIIPAARGEYTGLTDRNGVKIFKGDIIHVITTNSNGNFEIKFKYGQFYIGINMPIAYVRNSCEVIGNIHDNPELLEGDGKK